VTRGRLAWSALAAVLVLGLGGWYFATRDGGNLAAPGSEAYEQVTRSFYRGLAAMDVGLLDDAGRDFTQATELAPGEPAAWANLGLVRLRLGELDAAAEPIERAATLAAERGDIQFLLGRMKTAQGQIDEGIVHLQRAVQLDPAAIQARFALAEETERSMREKADDEAQRIVEELLAVRADNLAVLLERTRLAAKRGDLALVRDSIGRLRPYAATWPPVAVEQLTGLEQAVAASNIQAAVRSTLLLRNVLLRVPAFLEDLAAVKTAAELFAEPLDRFIRLPAPSSTPSPADTAIAYAEETVDPAAGAEWSAMLALSLDGTDRTALVAASAREVRRLDSPGSLSPFPGGTPGTPPSGHGLVALDWNHDFRTDLLLAGRGGVRLLLQDAGGRFADATAQASRGARAFTAPAFGAWTADIEMDGDLDIVVGVLDGPPTVLRNNGDGTWQPQQPFSDITGARAFAWGDVDRDGGPDAVFLDAAGAVSIFVNRQAGSFQRLPAPDDLESTVALTLGDINADSGVDLITLGADGSIGRSSLTNDGWTRQTLASWSSFPNNTAPGSARLLIADLDNNGAIDIVGSSPLGSAIWLADEALMFRAIPAPSAEIFTVAHANDDGRLDLFGLSSGRPVRLLGRGTRNYHWQVIRPRAQPSAGDQRINPFGVGGDVEIRSGLLVQKQILTGGPVHFGLGDRARIDVARIVWPNGVPQAEFDVEADGTIVAEQRLKGSCPWVFTYDGTGMRFVTDFLWRSPLGLRINAQDTAGVTQTEDWIKIRGDQLAPRGDAYDVRITAELWETHYIDHVSLMAVDHPAGTEVYVDERFSRDAPALAVHATERPRPVVRARDHTGDDVTALVAEQDGRYLATFERGRYQGVAREHFVEFDIGREIERGRRLWLLAHGWVYPTDSSINAAIGQGAGVQPRGLSLEAQDARGRWVVISPDLGFPAGKHKTILIDLVEVSRAGIGRPQRLRLRTNLEIYWDLLATASPADEADLRTTRLTPSAAALRYRGFSRTAHLREDVPELPAYAQLANVSPRWRDLIGYYTRFGEVRELVARVDDRYVIMNAGDELQLRFAALPPPPAGWTRDYVLAGDGWNKDGDYNTSHSKTVEPLPSHDRPAYGASGTLDLELDPVYRAYPDDWRTYHTRFATPRRFLDGLR
jgi:Tfp pilus assembly protein PilF